MRERVCKEYLCPAIGTCILPQVVTLPSISVILDTGHELLREDSLSTMYMCTVYTGTGTYYI